MELLAILILIATCLAVATDAQQTTLKPSTSKSTTSNTTTSKTTTPSVIVTTTVKTTSKPTVTTTKLKPTTITTMTLKPTTTTTTLKPTTTTTTLKPTTTTTTLKPTTTTKTTLKPTTTPTTLKPTTTATTLKPTTTTTTLKPTATTLKPTTTTTTLKPTTTTKTTLKPTTTTTTLKPTTTTTTLKPTTTTTTLKPTTTTKTTLKPTTTTTTLKPTTTTTTLKPTTTTTTLKPTTTTTTLKPTTTTKTTLKSTTTTTTLKPTTTTLKPTTTTTTLKATTTTTTLKPTVTTKTTTLKTAVTSTTLKPTVTSTTLNPLKITTSNPTVATTSKKPDVSTTTFNPPTKTEFFLCRDTYSTALSGTIQPDQNSTNSNCSFDIVAPSNQQIQISCFSFNFTAATSNSFSINGDLDNSWPIVPNRTYYSVNNTLNLNYLKFINRDSFSDSFYCNWTTAPKEITNQPKLCRHAESTAANGTVHSLASGDTGPDRSCSFFIKALPDQQIQISCSAINFTSSSYSTFLSIDGTLDELGPYSSPVSQATRNQRFTMYSHWTPPVLNRIYYSSGNNLTINSEFGYQDSFKCNWTTVPKEMTTNNKLCRHSQSSLTHGTIQPLSSDGGPPRTCYFPISVLPSQRIQISCSDLNLTTQNAGNLNFLGITELIPSNPGPKLNRMYYSADNNAYVTSQFGKENSFKCNWTAIAKENTTDFQFCRHGLASMANGTLQPFSEIGTDEIRGCQFIISATPDYKIQISCPIVNLTTQLSTETFLGIQGIADENVYKAPVSNRIYYSNADNRVALTAKVSNTDRFRCNWTITPREKMTVNNKLCRDTVSTTTNGTVQPLITGGAAEPPRQCTFIISSRSDEQIQISCSYVGAGSPLIFDGVIDYAAPPEVNRVYTSEKYSNQIEIYSQVYGNSSQNWFDCKWTITPRGNTTNNKLCINTESTTANGTLQPIAGHTGSPRQCDFSISSLPNEKIQISCSVVNLTNPNSYFRIDGIVSVDDPPVVNRVYTSYPYSSMMISSQLGGGEWIDCKWTTTPRKNTAQAQLCNDMKATSANGTIQSTEGDTGPLRWCFFSISAPSDKQIQISCSIVNLTSASRYLRISGTSGSDSIQPAVNQVYYSTKSNYVYLSSYLGYGDRINCQWITVPDEITTEPKLCRHSEATTPNGTIQPIAGNNTGPPRKCSFSISAPYDQQIKISCPVVNLTDFNSYFEISGDIDDYVYSAPVVNRVYTSLDNEISISSKLGSGDWISCNWTTTPKRNTTNNKLCQNAGATTPNGTIEPMAGDSSGISRSCSFFINAAPDEQIQISCSNVTLNTTAGSSLSIDGTVDSYGIPAVVSREYYSSSIYNQKIYISSQLGNGDWISCNWKTLRRKNTTESKFCRDDQATLSTGRIQPLLVRDSGPPRSCPFTINALDDQQIQITCSAVNLTDFNSYFEISGSIDKKANPPVVNRVYTSSYDQISINSQLGNRDWIDCNWTIIPRENTTKNKLCQNIMATTANGTIQPILEDTGPVGSVTVRPTPLPPLPFRTKFFLNTVQRQCSFSINAPWDQQIQISCPVVNLTDPSSYFQIYGIIDNVNSAPTVNRVYTSSYSPISINSKLGNGEWINCNWTTTPKKNTTNNKLCQNIMATTANGTIQPILGDTGTQRQCSFSIKAPWNQQIQISCPIVNVTDSDSYFQISGAIDYDVYPAPVANRVYTSLYSEIDISSQLGNGDWTSCNWTTILPRENTTKFKFCLDARTTSASGSIQPLVGDAGTRRSCPFTITAPNKNQIQISCSAVNFTNPTSSLQISGVIDAYDNQVRTNRVYYSTSSNSVTLTAKNFGNTDWFSCNWTTVSIENKTDNQLCHQSESTTANGTLQPISLRDPPRNCSFYINGPIDEQIQFSCSVMKLTNLSYFTINGVVDSVFGSISPPAVNRVYYSDEANPISQIYINSRLGYQDLINCSWTTAPKENTTNYKFCRHESTTSTNGTIQTIRGDPGPSRNCIFYIDIYSSLKISCSVVNITSPGSYMNIISYYGGPNVYSPEVNTVYTYPYGYIQLISQIGVGDSFYCNWQPTA